MNEFLRDISTLFLDTILPVRCAACKQESKEAICESCLKKFPLQLEQRCIACAKPSPFGLTHDSCKTRSTADRLLCAYSYRHKGLAESIIVGKYKFIPDVFSLLGKHMARVLAEELSILDPDSVLCTPLPLHTRRHRWRGFNQAAVLCKEIAMHVRAPRAELLVRTKYTKTQKNLGQTDRKANVQDCFALVNGAEAKDKTIVLIDDVTTTGSTLLEAAKVLKRNGANTVWCLALAQD